ncbi:MAG: ABC transporter ATP-binding protein [Anaerolineales bacterium]|nr:ABC transporter ATP-binding protein [Anaerolineales bacterium]
MSEAGSNFPLSIKNLTFQYHIRETPAISDITLDLHSGELMLVAGSSGCGKTTLMRCINGLIPRSYKGTRSGDVFLFGEPAAQMQMADLSQTVGTLLQDPEQQIVSSYVVNEVAFGLENLALPREEILERVDETLDHLGILNLRDRETFMLSGGEKQKVALAGVLVMRPKILLLDEPLASLDPASAQEALQIFRRLADEGISVMLVEHRVDDVLGIRPDTVLYIEDGRISYSGSPEGLMEIADFHRIKLPAIYVMERARKEPEQVYEPKVGSSEVGMFGDELLSFEHVDFRYSKETPQVLYDVSFQVCKGDVVGILGPNGAGKTTLVKHALGLLKPTEGTVKLQGVDTRDTTVAACAKSVGYAFQNPAQMLFAPTVQEELEFGPRNIRIPEGEMAENIEWALSTLNIEEFRSSPPLALSYGQQKRVSIGAILSMRSRILALDEPTAGQDFWNYRYFMDSILQMPGFDAVIFITHDLDLALTYATKLLLVANGRVAAFGKTSDVLKDRELLDRCRLVPTSLLELNLKYEAQLGEFMRAEMIAHRVSD